MSSPDLFYYLPQFHKLSLRAYYDYNRETDTDNFDELFVNHSIILNAELPFRIARAQQIFLGLNLNLSFYGNPEPPRRNNYSLYANYDLALSRSFFARRRVSVRRARLLFRRSDRCERNTFRERKLSGSRLAHIERSQLFRLESVKSQCLRLQRRQHRRRRSADSEILTSGEQSLSS